MINIWFLLQLYKSFVFVIVCTFMAGNKNVSKGGNGNKKSEADLIWFAVILHNNFQ